MTGLSSLSPLARDLLALWSNIVCIGSIICAVQACKNKKAAQLVLSVLCLAASYAVLWMRKTVILYSAGSVEAAARAGAVCSQIPWLLSVILLLIPSILLTLSWVSGRRFAAGSITPAAVKYFMDEMPCGIGYFRKNGQVLFSNRQINRLCIAMTGKPLINGNTFRDALTTELITVDGKKWCFSISELMLSDEPVYELIASDRTALYDAADILQEDNKKLEQLSRELRAYNLAIDDIVRKQEMLQIKIDIHDEMNQLILSAAALDDNDVCELDRVYHQWLRNMNLLHANTGQDTQQNEQDQLAEFAQALGIQLSMSAPVASSGLTEQQKELLFIAAREAIANAAKHAHASCLELLFEENETVIRCCFRNDGLKPASEICFTGGLKNLKDIAPGYGAEIAVQVNEAFELSLVFSKVL